MAVPSAMTRCLDRRSLESWDGCHPKVHGVSFWGNPLSTHQFCTERYASKTSSMGHHHSCQFFGYCFGEDPLFNIQATCNNLAVQHVWYLLLIQPVQPLHPNYPPKLAVIIHTIRALAQPSHWRGISATVRLSYMFLSWNFRSCWHRTGPPLDTPKTVRIYSFQLKCMDALSCYRFSTCRLPSLCPPPRVIRGWSVAPGR